MAINDFKAKVLRVNQVINSGSTSTSPLLVYGLGSATDASGSFTAAHFAGTGSDVWMFVSGTQKSAGSAGSYGAVAFKGDVVVSGVLQIGEQASAASTPTADKGAIYAVTGNLFFKNDDGVESNLLSSSAGGSNQQVQFNDNGALNGDTSFTYDASINTLVLTGSLIHGGDDGGGPIAYDFSHAEGLNTSAIGFYSHAEGVLSTASGNNSHAEGSGTTASGESSHAEGRDTIASANYSHAEGYGSVADAPYSHAAGRDTVASGSYSYVGGQGTISSGSYQHVIGRYNKRNNDTSLFVIGDGTGNSDALRGDIVRVNTGSSIGAGRVEVTGTLAATLGFTGSITKLVGGGDYLIAGTNITLTTGSLGEVTIAATAGGGTPAGSNTQVQFNDDGAFGGKSTFAFATGSDRLSVTHVSASTITASFISPGSPLVIRPQGDTVQAGSDVFFFVSGSTTDVSVFQGDLTTSGSVRLKDTSDTVRVSLIPNGQISGSGALLAGGNITAGGSVAFGNGTLVTTSSTATIANVTATTVNFAGAATTLTMGATSGTGSIRNASVTLPNATLINLSSVSAVTIGHVGASGQNLTISSSNGKVLVEGTAFSVDNVSVPGILEVTGSATGSIARFEQLSGSLTKLQDGTTNYLEAGSGISITTGSNGQVTIAGGGGAAPYNAYTTTVGSPFTLAIPAQCSIIEIEACGGGGGGGSGRRAPLGNNAYGGGGGSGASRVFYSIAASAVRAISTNLTITIGAGGNGGNAQTLNNTDGLDGSGGGNTTVAAGATTLVTATGGALGKGGTAASAPGGVALFSQASGGDGGAGQIPVVAAQSGKNAIYAGGGGAGGGRDAANPGAAVQAGGTGGSGGDLFADNVNRRGTAGPTAGGTGGNATVPANPSPTGGGGGGGGGSANGVAGGAGGNGVQGGGGGGGGACTDGFNSGAGGKGGDGWCVVRFF